VLVKNQIGTSAKTNLYGEAERILQEQFAEEMNSFFGKVVEGGLPVALPQLMRESQLHQTPHPGMTGESINGYLASKLLKSLIRSINLVQRTIVKT
jgi:hypothetical protein